MTTDTCDFTARQQRRVVSLALRSMRRAADYRGPRWEDGSPMRAVSDLDRAISALPSWARQLMMRVEARRPIRRACELSVAHHRTERRRDLVARRPFADALLLAIAQCEQDRDDDLRARGEV